MNTKRLIGLMPFLFLISIIIVLGILYLTTRSNNQADCKGPYNYTDLTNEINIDFDCSWKLTIDNQISDNYAQNSRENLRRRFLKVYDITLEKNNSKINFSSVLLAAEPKTISLEPNSFIRLNDKLTRSTDSSSNTYQYGEYVKCSDVDSQELNNPENYTDCAKTGIEEFSKSFLTRISGEIEEELLEEVDEIVKFSLTTI